MDKAKERDVVEGVQKWIGRGHTNTKEDGPKTDAGPPVIYALARSSRLGLKLAGPVALALSTNNFRPAGLLRLRVYSTYLRSSFAGADVMAGLTGSCSRPLPGLVSD